MAQLMRRVDGTLSTLRLSKALRLYSQEDEAFALTLLHTELESAPEYDLSRDDQGFRLLLLTSSEYDFITKRLCSNQIKYDPVEVRAISELSAEKQRTLRGWTQ